MRLIHFVILPFVVGCGLFSDGRALDVSDSANDARREINDIAQAIGDYAPAIAVGCTFAADIPAIVGPCRHAEQLFTIARAGIDGARAAVDFSESTGLEAERIYEAIRRLREASVELGAEVGRIMREVEHGLAEKISGEPGPGHRGSGRGEGEPSSEGQADEARDDRGGSGETGGGDAGAETATVPDP